MIYLKTEDKQIAYDFYSILKFKMKNDYWIKRLILRKELVKYQNKNEEVEYIEWIVEALTICDKELSAYASLPKYSEQEAREMIKEHEDFN